jgi:hypothetical protein
MKCEECTYFISDYFPNKCDHRSNLIYLKLGGLSYKKTAQELNPDDKCEMGTKKSETIWKKLD